MHCKRGNKGFTLAELLIVVAIIGVLVSIGIPVFNDQLERAREAEDLANIRSIYAECSIVVMTKEPVDGVNYISGSDSASKHYVCKRKEKGWLIKDATIAGHPLPHVWVT